jgi:MFS family permease
MSAPSSSGSLISVLARHPDFRLFWTANLVSSSGVWMQNLAQGWLILKLSNSPFLLGAAGFASLFPTLVLSLIGGTVADRMDRRRILIATHTGLMLLALLLGTLTGLGVVTPLHILVVILLAGVATALNSPAYQAAIPDLVPPSDLTRAIALNSIQFNVARIAGHSSAGLLVAAVGEAGCFYINGLTYLAMLYALARMQPFSGHERHDEVPFWVRFTEGLEYVSGRKIVRYAIAMIGLMSLLGLPYFFLLPSIGRDVLGQGAERVGYLMASVSLGALAGAVSMTRIVPSLGPKRTAVLASILFWIVLLAFSMSRSYWLSMSLLVALGFALVLAVAAVNNLLQVLTPPAMRGRVMGLYAMALNGFAPVGGLLAGSAAEAFSSALAIGAMACVGLMLSAGLAVKMVGQAEAQWQHA